MKTKLAISINNLTDFNQYRTLFSKANLDKPLTLVEILWDNYCHLPPEKISEYISEFGKNISFHIMWSKFLEMDDDDFDTYLIHLKHHIEVVKPYYVSDHICQFSYDGIHLLSPQELDYRNSLDIVCSKVRKYQDSIGMSILLENYASTSNIGKYQVDFFNEVINRTGCGMLFDISNAMVAELNGIENIKSWYPLLSSMNNCHVGGYAFNPRTQIYYDSHDSDVTTETLIALDTILNRKTIDSICYERDYNKITENMINDIRRINNRLGVS
jgi:uncharacterized protein (UPF0276 family)